MPLVEVGDLEEGMILGKDIKDRSGRTLLKADMELSEKHLKIFKTWGISHVEIQGDDTPADLQSIIDAHPELEEQAEETAVNLFQHVDTKHEFFSTLIPLWKKRYIRELASKI